MKKHLLALGLNGLSALSAFTALITLSAPVFAATAPVGVPTYQADATLDVLRGYQRPITYLVAIQTGFNGSGSSSATTGPLYDHYPNARASEASAASSATELKAVAVSSGTVDYDPNVLPHAHALARAENTSFFQFGASWQMEFIALLDGALSGAWGFIEAPTARNLTRMSFGLELLDANGSLLGTIFEAHAQIDYRGRGDILHFSQGSSGFADPALWASAFTQLSDDRNQWGRPLHYDVGYTDRINTNLQANAGDLFGFRWYLEAESWLEGYAVNAEFVADFGHTAGFDLALSAEERQRLGVVQLLSFPAGGPGTPLPLPATPVLLLLALLALAVMRGERRGA